MAETTSAARKAAERLTGVLFGNPDWRPRRSHIEGAINDLREAADAIEQMQKALAEAVAYAQAVAVVDGMPEDKQCNCLTAGPLEDLKVFDVAAARAALSSTKCAPERG